MKVGFLAMAVRSLYIQQGQGTDVAFAEYPYPYPYQMQGAFLAYKENWTIDVRPEKLLEQFKSVKNTFVVYAVAENDTGLSEMNSTEKMALTLGIHPDNITQRNDTNIINDRRLNFISLVSSVNNTAKLSPGMYKLATGSTPAPLQICVANWYLLTMVDTLSIQLNALDPLQKKVIRTLQPDNTQMPMFSIKIDAKAQLPLLSQSYPTWQAMLNTEGVPSDNVEMLINSIVENAQNCNSR